MGSYLRTWARRTVFLSGMMITKNTAILLLLLDPGSAALFRPSSCTVAIIKCCNADGVERSLPFRCFEVNNCPGLYWEGRNACSRRTLDRAFAAFTRNARLNMDDIDVSFNGNGIES